MKQSLINQTNNNQTTEKDKQEENDHKKSPLHQYFKKKLKLQIKTMENIQQKSILMKKQPNIPEQIKIASNNSKSIKTSIRINQENKIDKIIQQNQLNSQNKITMGSFKKSQISCSNFLQIKKHPIEQSYEIKQILGEGGFGTVFRGICKKTGQQRAIKQLKMKKINESKKKQILSQFTLMKRLNHPNIVTLYDLIEYKNQLYVIMQYCQGGQLFKNIQVIRKKSQQIIANILNQILSALNYLHSLNIVHRDIKLQNIVSLRKISQDITQNNIIIKIIDFGTAIESKYKIMTNVPQCGTLSYMAPQMFKKILTHKSDIWSTAILISILLTGKSPTRGQTNSQIIDNVLKFNFNPNSPQFINISPQAKDLLSKMLDINFYRRIAIMDIFKHPFLTKSQHIPLIEQCDVIQLSRLQKFQRKNNLVTTIQTYLSLKKVKQQERQKLSRLYKSIDTDNSGLIDKQQIIKFFKQHSQFYNEKQLRKNLDEIDLDKSGKIDFGQFIVAMAKKQHMYGRQQLTQVFHFYDKDNTGYLDLKQLKNLLNGCDAKEINYFFKQLDIDNDNKITLKEFVDYLTKQ